MSHPQKVECLYFRKDGEWYRGQYAINGVKAHPVECHASVPAERHWTEAQIVAYLVRSSQTMIELFGDARSPLPLEGAA